MPSLFPTKKSLTIWQEYIEMMIPFETLPL